MVLKIMLVSLAALSSACLSCSDAPSASDDAGVPRWPDARSPDARADARHPVCDDASVPADADGTSDAAAPDAATLGGQQTGCGPGEGCYVNIPARTAACQVAGCDGEGACSLGATCWASNRCYAGSACVGRSTDGGGGVCAKLCDASFTEGLTLSDLPLAADAIHNGVAPWSCGRDDDAGGAQDSSLPYPRYVCIPLGGEGPIRYSTNLSAADGWPYGSSIGVCIDTLSAEFGGNPYTRSSAARSTAVDEPSPVAAHRLRCNPATNVGCGPNEKCGVVKLDNGTWARTDCVTDGDKREHEACSFDGQLYCGSGSGVSDCVGGTACVDGVCVNICDIESVFQDCGEGLACRSYLPYFGSAGMGICGPSCEPLGVAP